MPMPMGYLECTQTISQDAVAVTQKGILHHPSALQHQTGAEGLSREEICATQRQDPVLGQCMSACCETKDLLHPPSKLRALSSKHKLGSGAN